MTEFSFRIDKGEKKLRIVAKVESLELRKDIFAAQWEYFSDGSEYIVYTKTDFNVEFIEDTKEIQNLLNFDRKKAIAMLKAYNNEIK